MLIEAARWDDLVPRLLAYTRAYLAQYGESEGRRWHAVTHSYVLRTVEAVLARGPECVQVRNWVTLFQLLCLIVGTLIDEEERKLRDMLEGANWADLIPRVIAHTVRKLGDRIGAYGKSPEDYVYEAVLQLFNRRRHFPVDRGVSLFTFLCNTVHGMRTNDQASRAAEGHHVSIVDSGEPARDQYNAALLTAPVDVTRELSRTIESFIASLEPDLQQYARLRAQEAHRTAAEYADALGVSEQTIRNFDRRLRRRWQLWNDVSLRGS